MPDWIFDPKPDITAHEVARLLVGYVAQGGQLRATQAQIDGEDPNSIPHELRRHFRPDRKNVTPLRAHSNA